MSPTVRVLETVRDVPREAWDALVGDESPFLEWDWLAALEEGGTVGRETGWLTQHLTLWDAERLVGACPLYVKAHSMGEFVFDQAWAAAAHRAGIAYYPKLLVGVPFTPVTGVRFLARPDDTALVRVTLGTVLERSCADHDFSSVHVNFCRPDEAEALAARGWLRRVGFQYQWRNAGFGTFDDYGDTEWSSSDNGLYKKFDSADGVTGNHVSEYTSSTAASTKPDAWPADPPAPPVYNPPTQGYAGSATGQGYTLSTPVAIAQWTGFTYK